MPHVCGHKAVGLSTFPVHSDSFEWINSFIVLYSFYCLRDKGNIVSFEKIWKIEL